MVSLHEHREPQPGRFDAVGFALAGVGFGSVMYAISEGPAKGWASPLIVSSGIVSALLVVIFVVVELRTAQHLLDLRLLRDRLFCSTSVGIFLGMGAFLGTLYLVAPFYQHGLGRSALVSGLSTFSRRSG